MKHKKDDLPTRLDANGVCIQAEDWGEMNVARIRFPAGADATPLLEGMPDNLCQCPHWGKVLKGSIHVRYADGTEETVREGEVYYWPPGHTVWVDEDYEAVEFSPSEPMCRVIDHLKAKMG
ncbi:MAG: cupin domain-containing protein [Alphaproteobacteria bacterium]